MDRGKPMKYAFEFLDVEIRPGKPRASGLTIVRDRMRGLRDQTDFLETYAPFVDFVKISNITPRFYPESLLVDKLALYRKHDVCPFFGGILFENAVAQGKLEAFYAYLPEIGITTAEISDNIVDLSRQELLASVRRCTDMGIRVFVEWGDKYAQTPLDVDRAEAEIIESLEAGASHVVLERGEIDVLLAEASGPAGIEKLHTLSERVGTDRLILEVETEAQVLAMLRLFGGGVNLGPNIDFELVKWLEPSRAGVSREIGHLTIENQTGPEGVRTRVPSEKGDGQSKA